MCVCACTQAHWLVKQLLVCKAVLKALRGGAPTLRVLVGVGDVLPLITAHTLSADLHAHDQGAVDGLVHGPIVLPDPIHHVGIDLGKDKRRIVLGVQVTLLDGTDRNGATAVCPCLGGGGETRLG